MRPDARDVGRSLTIPSDGLNAGLPIERRMKSEGYPKSLDASPALQTGRQRLLEMTSQTLYIDFFASITFNRVRQIR